MDNNQTTLSNPTNNPEEITHKDVSKAYFKRWHFG